VFRRRSRSRSSTAIALGIASIVAAGSAAAVALRQRRRATGAQPADAELIVKRLLEEPWKGNFDVIDEYVAAGYVGHDPAEAEPIRGPAGVRANFDKYIAGFPRGAITVDDQFSEGDEVATRWTGRGTHAGEIAGIAPTGKEVTVTGLTISKLEGGKVVEEWTSWDSLGMLVQLGAAPEPARAQFVDR
jgi:predicted ester cyclase